MALVTYSHSFAEHQMERKKGTCQACKRESLNVKTCTRCGQVKYCNKTCQKKDFQKHKELCIMWSNFEAAKNKISADMKRFWLNRCGKMGFSFFLASLPDLTRYNMIGQRVCVIVEIIKVHYLDGEVLPLIEVRDVTNQSVLMYFKPGSMNMFGVALLFTPGRFLILLDVPIRVYSYTNSSSAIYIEHWEQLKAIV